MSIISLSLNDEILKQLDAVQKEQGFSGRSDAVRAAIRLLADEHQQRKRLHGAMSAMLLVVHDEAHTEEFAAIRHKYLRSIRTQLHDHLEEHKCMELLLLRGDAKEISRLAQECQTAKGVMSAKLIPL